MTDIFSRFQFDSLSYYAKEELRVLLAPCAKTKVFFAEPCDFDLKSAPPVTAAVLGKFTKSIEKHGFLTPVVISPHDSTVKDGVKRCRAAAYLGLQSVPCIYSNEKGAIADEIITGFIKNRTLHYFDSARLISALIDDFLYTQDALAAVLGVSQSFIANKQRLLRFTEAERQLIIDYALPERTARSLLRISDITLRCETVDFIHSNKLTVSASEQYIDRLVEKKPPGKYNSEATFAVRSIERLISSFPAGGDILFSKHEDERFIKLNIVIPKGFT